MNALFACTILALAAEPASLPTRAILLDDFRVVEGVVHVINGVVRIEPATGSATIVSARQVLFEGASRQEVYEFMSPKFEKSTPEGHAQLAAWCEKVEMMDQAILHATTAKEMAPDDARFARYLESLQTRKTKPNSEPRSIPRELTKPASPRRLVEPAITAPPAAVQAFGHQIQPILMNQCASCHTHKNYVGTFKLDRVDPGYANPGATAANLPIVVSQLNPKDLTRSPLLVKALTMHGGQKQPAFLDRSHPAYRVLEAWSLSLAPAPIPASAPIPVVAMPAVQPVPTPFTAAPSAPVGFAAAAPAVTTATASVTPPMPMTETPTGSPMPVVVSPPVASGTTPVVVQASSSERDPFDPAIFNSLPQKPR